MFRMIQESRSPFHKSFFVEQEACPSRAFGHQLDTIFHNFLDARITNKSPQLIAHQQALFGQHQRLGTFQRCRWALFFALATLVSKCLLGMSD